MTAIPRIALVASPAQRDLVQAIGSRLTLAGLLCPTPRPWSDAPAPVYPHIEALLGQTAAAICCFLVPYSSLKKDLVGSLERGTHVLGAGPVSLSRREYDHICRISRQGRVHFSWCGRHRHSLLHQALSLQRQKPSFGDPVYLRQISGSGPGRLPSWWAACQALEQAEDLLAARVQDLHLTAVRKGRRHHVALTAHMANRATAQLVIAPVPLPGDGDISLLGSGGLLSSDSLPRAPALITQQGVHLLPHPELHPEPSWLLDFAKKVDQSEIQLPDWSTLSFQKAVLRAMRQALQQGRPVQV